MKQSNFQFTDPSLVYIKFVENKNFDIQEGESIEIDAKIDSKHDAVSDNEYLVSLIVTIGKEDDTSPFLIEAEIAAQFKWDGQDEECTNKETYLKQNAPALLVSYLRPIIAMITNSSHYPAYNLPFINFVQ